MAPNSPTTRPSDHAHTLYPTPAVVTRQAQPHDALLRGEWLLTNGLGGFAMGTAAGVPLRRYHGWLVGATKPPVGRVLALANCVEWLVLELVEPDGDPKPAQRLELSTFRFENQGGGPAVMSPRGIDILQSFERDDTVRWTYAFGPVRVVRELILPRGQNSLIIRYRVRTGGNRARLEVRPLVAMRDFHGPLRSRYGPAPDCHAGPTHVRVQGDANAADHTLTLSIGHGLFTPGGQWWNNFEYLRDAERGQECHEDLFSPGLFHVELDATLGEHVVEIHATLTPRDQAPARISRDLDAQRLPAIIARTLEGVPASAPLADRDAVASLVRAADQFVVRRDPPPTAAGQHAAPAGVTVIAGYPWFGDWGRDTTISLPGLLLSTGRTDEARLVLETFARHAKHGLVPNLFNEQTGEAEYNTADASLWYVHAACEFHRVAGRLPQSVLACCRDIIDAYRRGTDFAIRMDDDALITAGDPGTQFTWMDAKRDGVVFTPRHGKPVEINALWHSVLRQLADVLATTDAPAATELRSLADRAAASFRDAFWNGQRRMLFDVLEPSGGSWIGHSELRPNQIFALSLPHSPLDDSQRRCVLAAVREHLLTPMGLRTLAPREPGYRGRYRGTLFERDAGYHNGTVWPWLLGAYAEAVLRVGDFAPAARAEAAAALRPLVEFLTQGTSLGQLPEIFDGDDTAREARRADGCPAQAWSVAEVLRVWLLCLRQP